MEVFMVVYGGKSRLRDKGHQMMFIQQNIDISGIRPIANSNVYHISKTFISHNLSFIFWEKVYVFCVYDISIDCICIYFKIKK